MRIVKPTIRAVAKLPDRMILLSLGCRMYEVDAPPMACKTRCSECRRTVFLSQSFPYVILHSEKIFHKCHDLAIYPLVSRSAENQHTVTFVQGTWATVMFANHCLIFEPVVWENLSLCAVAS